MLDYKRSEVYAACARGLGLKPRFADYEKFRTLVDMRLGPKVVASLQEIAHPLQPFVTVELVSDEDGRTKPLVRWGIREVEADDPEIAGLLREGAI